MKTEKIVITFVLLFVSAFSNTKGDEKPWPKVDERIELMDVVYRLINPQRYSSDLVRQYAEDVDRYFEPYRDHGLVHLIRDLRQHPASTAHYILQVILNDGSFVFRNDIENDFILPRYQWTEETKEKFLTLLNDFYTVTDFQQFFDEHRPLYDETERNYSRVSESVDFTWFERFFGGEGTRFKIVPRLLSKSYGTGIYFRLRSGKREAFALIGPAVVDENGIPAYEKEWENEYVLVHEFCHAFCNPLIYKHETAFEESSKRIFSVFERTSRLVSMYRQVQGVQCELATRAATLRYFANHPRTQYAGMVLKHEKTQGFFPIEQWNLWLSEYENSRDEYPTLDDFMPEIARRQDTLFSKEHIRLRHEKLNTAKDKNRPTVASFEPANGAKAVAPDIKELRVTFDRTMQPWYAWCRENDETYPEFAGNPVWSKDRKTSILPVKLKPGRTYRIWINDETHDAFRSQAGSACTPTLWTFTTSGEESHKTEITPP